MKAALPIAEVFRNPDHLTTHQRDVAGLLHTDGQCKEAVECHVKHIDRWGKKSFRWDLRLLSCQMAAVSNKCRRRQVNVLARFHSLPRFCLRRITSIDELASKLLNIVVPMNTPDLWQFDIHNTSRRRLYLLHTFVGYIERPQQ